MNSEDVDLLRTYERMTWRTAISQRVERFSTLIADQAVFDKYFGEEYVEALSKKIDHLFRLTVGMGIAYAVLMVSLYVSQDSKNPEFEIFGYGFKNLGYYKEFLLLLATAISPISSTVSVYHRYLIALRSECLKRLAPDPSVREFFSYTRVDRYFDPLLKTDDGTSRVHGLAKSLVAVFVFALFLLLLALFAGSFILQLNVIYNVASHPAATKYVNLFVIAFSLAAIVLSWVIGAMQLPLPEVNLSFYGKLEEVRKIDETRYKALLAAMSRISARRERFGSAMASAMSFVICYLAISIWWRPESLNSLEIFVAEGVGGAFLTAVLGVGITEWTKKRLYERFFKRHPIETPDRLPAFTRLRRVLTIVRVATPVVLAVLFAVLSLRN